MKVYLTSTPTPPNVDVVKAVRQVMVEHGRTVGLADAHVLVRALAHDGKPALLFETEDEMAVEDARLRLSHHKCAIDVDIDPTVAVEQEPVEPEDVGSVADATHVSFLACKWALVLMKVADGNPAMALNHAALMGRLNGETRDKPGVFRQAAGVLLEAFPADLMDEVADILKAEGVLTEDGGLAQ